VDATIGAQIWNKYPISPVDVAHGGTGLTSTTANQLLYSSGASTIAGLATANNGVLVTDGSGVPSIAAALSTSPAASQTSALSLGAAYQNTFGYDVLLTVYLNITVNAGGNVQCGVGPTNTPTQQTLLTGLAVLGYFPVAIYLPKNYYALLSATVTASITGQQAIPI
jgi:hypothetical protein